MTFSLAAWKADRLARCQRDGVVLLHDHTDSTVQLGWWDAGHEMFNVLHAEPDELKLRRWAREHDVRILRVESIGDDETEPPALVEDERGQRCLL